MILTGDPPINRVECIKYIGAKTIIQQCDRAGVPCFVKQLGSRPVGDHPGCPIECDCGLHHGFKDPKGGDNDEWPSDLRVRQFPNVEVRT